MPAVKQHLTLGLLTIVTVFVFWNQAGLASTRWLEALIALAAIALAWTVLIDETVLDRGSVPLAIAALPIYVCAQLIPLPYSLLVVLSPGRAELLSRINAVFKPVYWAPLTIDSSRTALALLSICGIAIMLTLVRLLVAHATGSGWIFLVPIMCVALWQGLLGISQSMPGNLHVAAHGTFKSRDHFACFLEMALPGFLLAGFSALSTRRSRRLARYGISGICFACATLTFVAILHALSKAGVILAVLLGATSLAVGLFYTVSDVTRLSRVRIAALCVGFAVFVAMSLPLELIHRFLQTNKFEADSIAFRFSFWASTWRVWEDFWIFGCGFGALEPALARYQEAATAFRVEYAHNDYLNLLAELGIAGCCALLGGAIVVVKPAMMVAGRIRKLRPSSCNGVLEFSACWLGVAAITSHSMVDFNFYVPANEMALAWLAGVASGLAERILAAPGLARDIRPAEDH